MQVLARKTAVGLDLGQSTTKLIQLERRGTTMRVLKAAVFRNREEGILTEVELGQHLGTWLKEKGCHKEEFLLSVPQYIAIAQMADFPPGATQLDDMVEYETRHLAGLSDESFLHGYCQFQPFLHYKNPVLIGVCRESAVRQRLQVVEHAKLKLADLGMESQALVRAYLQLIPEDQRRNELHLLLDMGAENSTLALVFNGQIVNVGSLLFGGDNFTQAMARHLGISEPEAEKTKRTSKLISAHRQSPLTIAASEFVAELQTLLDNWRSQLPEDFSKLPLQRIYLSGGSARLEGLDAYLFNALAAPVNRLAVPLPPNDEDLQGEEMVMAYGAAMMAYPRGRFGQSISLAPRELRWATKRRRRAPLLVLSLLIVIGFLAWHLTQTIRRLQEDMKALAIERDQLAACRTMLPQLKGHADEITAFREMLIPFAARGNRNRTFVTALEQLNQHRRELDFLLLLADEDSYRGNEPVIVAPRASPSIFAGGGPPPRPEDVLKPVTEFSTWNRLYASGLTAKQGTTIFRTIRETVDALNSDAHSPFTRVDILPDNMLPSTVFLIRTPWGSLMGMRSYTLELPLKQQEFK